MMETLRRDESARQLDPCMAVAGAGKQDRCQLLVGCCDGWLDGFLLDVKLWFYFSFKL